MEASIHENVQNVTRVDFDIFDNDEVLRYSAMNVLHPDTYDNNVAKIGGLIDPRLGVTDQFLHCATCKQNFLECPGHFGHCKLTEPMFHWGFMMFMKHVMSCICLKSCKLLIPVEELERKVITKSRRSRFTEIRNLCSSVKVSPYSGVPVPKLSIDMKKQTGLVNLVAEYIVNNNNPDVPSGGETNISVENYGENKKRVRQILTAKDCLSILKNMAAVDAEILGIPKASDMILYNFPIPPVSIRPSIKGDFISQGYSEHSTTHKLTDIIKFNEKLHREKERSLTVQDNQRYLKDYQDCLQYHVFTYYDNESTLPRSELKCGTGSAAPSITARLKGGKTARIRGNLQGKRVDFSARTVITSDPSNDVDELGVPLKIAMTITYPEIVTAYNIQEMTRLVRAGRDVYPGANYVENTQLKGPNGKAVRIDLRYRNKTLVLRYGWIVHRHLMNGDIVLFNRQPSLHKMSMMAHRVRVVQEPTLLTFRMNVTATDPYNADFDGDEMNLFAPQSIQSREELRRLADIKNHIISPKDSTPIISLKQDARLGSWSFTKDGYALDWKKTMILLSHTSLRDALMKGHLKLNKSKQYTGKEIMSYLIPGRINFENGKTLIRNGSLEKGTLGKKELGGSKNSITHLITDSYSKRRASTFMDDVQRITNAWLMMYGGFTVGLGDAMALSRSVREEGKNHVQKKILEVCNLITDIENTHMLDRKSFEECTYRELIPVFSNLQPTMKKGIDASNFLYALVESGSKGNWDNLVHIMMCLGQQKGIENALHPKKLNHRSLPHFPKQDDRPESRGFIKSSFLEGLSPTEFYFAMIEGRSGMIDTAIKTADSGYMSRRMIKATEDVYQSYDMTVRNATDGIIQFMYGDGGYDPARQMEIRSRLIIMDNATIKSTYGFTAEECKKLKITTRQSQSIVEGIVQARENLREFQRKALMNSAIIHDLFYLPFHIIRVIKYHSTRKSSGSLRSPGVQEIIDAIDEFLLPRTTRLFALNNQQSQDPTSVKYTNEMLHKSLFKALIHEQLSPKRVIFEYNMTTGQFKDMMDELVNSYNRNIVQPCEMVGILAAQSIGEPLTQFTLDTFHSSGMGDLGNLSSMSRFKELIGFTKNAKQPLMRIFLAEEHSADETFARGMLNSILLTVLKDIITNYEIVWDRNTRQTDVKTVFPVVGNALKKSDDLGQFAPWEYRFELDRMMLVQRGIRLLDIKMRFVSFWEDLLLDNRGLKKKQKDMILGVTGLYVYSSEESAQQPWFSIRMDMKEYGMTSMMDLLNLVREKFVLKGILGVTTAVCNQSLRKRFDPETGGLIEDHEFIITVQGESGSIMKDIIVLGGIDIKRTTTNDVAMIYSLFGIEATRAALIKELQDVYSTSGQTVNYQHLSLLVDIMTHFGTVTPVNRYGINRLDTDPLSRASFEKTVDQLIQAAIFQEVDKVKSVSSRIILGRSIYGGTGMVSLLADLEKLENTEYIENRYLMEVQDTIIPRLLPDPHILAVMHKN